MNNDADVLDSMVKEFFWSTFDSGSSAGQMLRTYYKCTKAAIVYLLVNAVFVCIGIIEHKVHPNWPFIKGASTYQIALFTICFMVHLFGVFATMFANISVLFHYSFHLNIQLKILANYFNRMTDDMPELTRMLISESYATTSSIINDRLIFGIEQYIRLNR